MYRRNTDGSFKRDKGGRKIKKYRSKSTRKINEKLKKTPKLLKRKRKVEISDIIVSRDSITNKRTSYSDMVKVEIDKQN